MEIMTTMIISINIIIIIITIIIKPPLPFLSAFCTDMRFGQLDANMPVQLVRLHVALSSKGFVAHVAGKGARSRVHALMRLQLGAERKGFGTGVAGEFAHRGVELTVLAQR
jgi:hypothetical protein